MNHITLTEDGMKLLVRVMRRADWMLSVSGALEANRIVNDVFDIPTYRSVTDTGIKRPFDIFLGQVITECLF